MNKRIIVLFCLLIVFSFGIFADSENSNELDFDVIKAKKLDVDVEIIIPIHLSDYTEKNNFIFKTPVFYDSPSQRVELDAYYLDYLGNKKNADFEEDEYGNKIAVFKIDSIKKDNYEFVISANIVSENKLILTKNIFLLDNNITEYEEYKLPSLNIQSDRGEIISLSKQISQTNNSFKELVEYTNWVHQNITYNLEYSNNSYESIEVLEEMQGVCDEFAVLEAALLRARGFPVRYVSGYANSTLEWEAHAWLEVYIPNQGWVPVDPTYGEVGLVDASHLKISVSQDSIDIKDKVTTANNVGVEFGTRSFDFNINSQENFEDLGYSNVLDIVLSSEEKMKEESAFEIKSVLKNTSINPIITLTQIYTHDQFELIYPKENNKIVYLEPFEEKEISYFYILPEISSPMYYNYLFTTQLKDVNGFVEIYKDRGIFKDAFFVYDPLYHFKNSILNIEIEAFNYTLEDKEIDINYTYNGKEYITNQIIPSLENIKITKQISEDINSLSLVISKDFDYSNVLTIYDNQIIEKEIIKPENIDDSNLSKDDLDENEYVNLWDEVDNLESNTPKNLDSIKWLVYVLGFIFLVLLIIFIINKRK